MESNVTNQTHPISPPPLPFLSSPLSRTRTRTHSLSFSTFSSSSEPRSHVEILFSWESLPGIPKQQIDFPTNRNRNRNHIPLPPGTSVVTSSECNDNDKKKEEEEEKKKIVPWRDPFFAALVECSKGGDKTRVRAGSGYGSGRKMGGLLDHLSCKSSAHIAHTLVFLPGGSASRRVSYDPFKKRPPG